MRLGRFDDAVKARRNALRLLGATAEREADLGEALTGAANGIVTAEAKEAFERARRARSATTFKARYFLGLAAEQDGRREGRRRDLARRCWRRRRRMRRGPASCANRWRASIRTPLPRVARPGRARTMSRRRARCRPSSATTMVRGMVARLAERLQAGRPDVEGWLRLLRAYMVLGDTRAGARRRGRRAPRARERAGQAAAGRRTGQRTGARRLTAMTRKQRRLVLIGVEPRRAGARGRAGAERAEGFDRVLQFADRRGREARRARHAASGSAGW